MVDLLRRARPNCVLLSAIITCGERETQDSGGGDAGDAGEGYPAGNEQYGVWREGKHDDLVFAVALACWASKRVCPNPPVGDAGVWRNEHFREAERVLRRFTTRELHG